MRFDGESLMPNVNCQSPEPTVSLVDLRPGDRCQLHSTSLEGSDSAILFALGLRGQNMVRLCKAGDPWIVEVRGTRIGLADEVARRLRVVPENLLPVSASEPAR